MDAHKNFALSTLASPPSGTAGTTLTVATGHGTRFPAVPFNVTLWPTGVAPTVSNAEIVRVTAIAGDVFTVTRAQEGTNARTHATNDQIAATITARTLTDVEYGAHGVINVKDPQYGAVGDGVTDDTAAFVSAVDTAFSAMGAGAMSKGATIEVPPGIYILSGNPFANVLATAQSTGLGVVLHLNGASLKPTKQIAVPANCVIRGINRLLSRIDFDSFTTRVNVSGVVLASNVVTVTTATAHGLEVGATAVVEGVSDTQFNGAWQVASVPSSVTFTFALTAANTSSSSGTVTIPMVNLGSVAPASLGCRLEYLTVDGSDLANGVAVFSNLINEQSGLNNVQIQGAYRRGVWIERSGSTASVTGPLNYTLDGVEVFCTSGVSAVGIYLRGTYGQHRGMNDVTIIPTNGAGTMATGIDISGTPGVYSRIHVEGCVNGILVGDRAGAGSGTDSSAGIVIEGITGYSGNTTLVRLRNAAEVNNVVLMGLCKLSGTNILVDEKNSLTFTDNFLGFYALSGGRFAGATTVYDGRLTVQYSATAPDGVALMQTAAGVDSPRLFLGNSTDGTSASLRGSGNTLIMSTGGVPGVSSGTGRAILSATAFSTQAGTGISNAAGYSGALTNVTTAYTALTTDYTILCDATGGAFDVTLPAAASNGGRIYVIKKIDASGNAVTINPNGAELIDGAATFPLPAQWDAVTIQCNSVAWFILGIGP